MVPFLERLGEQCLALFAIEIPFLLALACASTSPTDTFASPPTYLLFAETLAPGPLQLAPPSYSPTTGVSLAYRTIRCMNCNTYNTDPPLDQKINYLPYYTT